MKGDPKKTRVNFGLGPLRVRWPSPKDPDYQENAPKLAREWLNQLLREFGAPPPGVELRVSEYEHAGKTYYAVIADIEMTNVEVRLWLHHVRANMPETWDAVAVKNLLPEPENRTVELDEGGGADEEIPF